MRGQSSSTTFEPRRVLIVGAGPGLGAALARRFGREGFALTLIGRRLEPLTRLANTLRACGATAETVTADAANPIRFRAVLDDLAVRITPGVVVYNAARIA